jgi:hypothetical protein
VCEGEKKQRERERREREKRERSMNAFRDRGSGRTMEGGR